MARIAGWAQARALWSRGSWAGVRCLQDSPAGGQRGLSPGALGPQPCLHLWSLTALSSILDPKG